MAPTIPPYDHDDGSQARDELHEADSTDEARLKEAGYEQARPRACFWPRSLLTQWRPRADVGERAHSVGFCGPVGDVYAATLARVHHPKSL